MSTLESRASRAGLILAACLVMFLVLSTLAGSASPLH
jgi:hypothetical protein